MQDNANGFILALMFVAVAIIFGLIATWGIMALNIWATVIGIVGEIAWILGAKSML